MNCNIERCPVGHFYNDSIILLGVNNRSWKHTINCDNIFGVAKFGISFGLNLCSNHLEHNKNREKGIGELCILLESKMWCHNVLLKVNYTLKS